MSFYATTIGASAFELHSSSTQCRLLCSSEAYNHDRWIFLSFGVPRGFVNNGNENSVFINCGFTLNEIRSSRVTGGFRAAFDGGTFSTNSRCILSSLRQLLYLPETAICNTLHVYVYYEGAGGIGWTGDHNYDRCYSRPVSLTEENDPWSSSSACISNPTPTRAHAI